MDFTAALSRNPDLPRRIGVTLGVLALYRLGCWVPLPGVDISSLLAPAIAHSTAIPRVSIMALGIMPLLSALMLVEVAKIAVPALRAWTAQADNRAYLEGWVLVGALLLAAFQANGMAVALENIHSLVANPGLGFRAGVVVSLVAATAVVVWLASIITRHGIGNGFWIFVAVPYAVSFAEALVVQGSLWGSSSLLTIAISVGFLALCTAALAALSKSAPPLADTEELAWIPMLGFAAAGWLVAGALLAMVLLRWLLAPTWPGWDVDAILQWQGLVLIPLVALPLIVMLRRRSFATRFAAADMAAAMPLALVLAALAGAGTALAYLPDEPLFPGPALPLILAGVGLKIAGDLSKGRTITTTEPSAA